MKIRRCKRPFGAIFFAPSRPATVGGAFFCFQKKGKRLCGAAPPIS